MRPRIRPTLTALRFAAAAVLLAGCGGSDITGPLDTPPTTGTGGTGGTVSTAVARSLNIYSGNGQSGSVNAPAAQPLEVRVLDSTSAPVSGAIVSFAVKNARGTVAQALDTTGIDGLASTAFTFGVAAATDTVVASVRTPAAVLSATFALQAVPTAAKQLLIVGGGGAKSDTVGRMLRDTLAVAVRDSFNNALPNVDVTWTVASGSGFISTLNARTDTLGVARARWTLGGVIGTEAVSASVAGLAPASFTATAIGAGVAALHVVSGDAQNAAANTALAQPLVVQATDGAGAALPGAPITFATVLGTGTLSKTVDTTDAQGFARTRLTVGTAAGSYTVSATSANNKAVTFAERAVAAAAKAVVLVNGNNGIDTVRATLKDTLVVAVRDTFNNPVSGVSVTWTVTQGGGAVTLLTQPTDSAGRARALWSLGTAKGANALTASVSGLPAVTFNATALGAPASAITIVGGDNQNALVNQYVGDSITVRVEDAYGNVVGGAPITWTASNGGDAQGKQAVSGADGIASATWRLGAQPGPQTVKVTVNGRSVTFNAGATLIYRTVDAGGFNGCGITPSAQAYCWGYNGDGQLGTNSTSNRNIPTAIDGSLTFRQISGGRYHTCGITLSGIGYCWGDNHDGRLGTGDQTSAIKPAQVSTGITFQSIAAGRVQSCGLALSGLVYCWGFNQEGEVGAYIAPSVDSTIVKIPRPVSGQSFKTLSVGGLHACAIDISDDLYCWGFNNFGQIGNSATSSRDCANTVVGSVPWTLNNHVYCDPTGAISGATGIPVAVTKPAGVTSWAAVSAGYRHTCAIANTGATYCWGENQYGQLGNGTSSVNAVTYTPTLVSGGLTFTEISAGFNHTCAVTAAGVAYCWGNNTAGKLGDGTTSLSTVPVVAGAGKYFQHVSAGETLSCGITSSANGQTANVAYCWGDNSYGELGDGTNNTSLTPAKVAFQP